jgi:hypothetical protein
LRDVSLLTPGTPHTGTSRQGLAGNGQTARPTIAPTKSQVKHVEHHHVRTQFSLDKDALARDPFNAEVNADVDAIVAIPEVGAYEIDLSAGGVTNQQGSPELSPRHAQPITLSAGLCCIRGGDVRSGRLPRCDSGVVVSAANTSTLAVLRVPVPTRVIVDDLDRVEQRLGRDGQVGEGRITFDGGSVKPAHGRGDPAAM